jgi:hypothetical protein
VIRVGTNEMIQTFERKGNMPIILASWKAEIMVTNLDIFPIVHYRVFQTYMKNKLKAKGLGGGGRWLK